MAQLSKIDINENLPYQAWLYWHVTNQCNLDCDYCTLQKINRSVSIDIDRFTKVLDNTNKIFNISFSGGGEPFFINNLIKACQELTKKHYVSLVTNLTSNKIKEFANNIDPKRVILIIASAHLEEFEKNNLFNIFYDNYILLKNKNFEIKALQVAHPRYINVANNYKKLFYNQGIDLNFSSYIGHYKGNDYPKAYTEQELNIFGLNKEDIIKHYQNKYTCNAGYNVAAVDLDGNVFPCYHITKKIGHIYSSIKFNEYLVSCPSKTCAFPLKTYDPYLFKKALEKSDSKIKKYNILDKISFRKNNFFP